MNAADCRNLARSCFELSRLAKTQQEQLALRTEGARYTNMAEQIAQGAPQMTVRA